MQLTRFIQELLYQYECVTIPQFGAFLTRSYRAKVTPNGSFYPPSKELTFNQLLVANDGVLAHYIAQKEEISYENALRLIEKEVSSWKKRLQTQILRFPGVGEIRLNAARKIEFTPWGKINFDLTSFGLKSFERSPLSQTTPISKPIHIMKETNKNDLMFTPEKENNEKKTPLFRYAAIGVIGIALLGASYFFGDRYVTEQRIVEQEKAQVKIEEKVQEATFDLGNLPTIEVAATAKPQEAPLLDKALYSVIAGSFRSLENAEKKIESLKAEGYPAALAQSNSTGLYRVAFGRYETKKEAISMLYFLKYTLEEEAWYLEER